MIQLIIVVAVCALASAKPVVPEESPAPLVEGELNET